MKFRKFVFMFKFTYVFSVQSSNTWKENRMLKRSNLFQKKKLCRLRSISVKKEKLSFCGEFWRKKKEARPPFFANIALRSFFSRLLETTFSFVTISAKTKKYKEIKLTSTKQAKYKGSFSFIYLQEWHLLAWLGSYLKLLFFWLFEHFP